MVGDDLLDEAEAKACPGAARCNAIKGLENPFPLIFGYSLSLIGNRDLATGENRDVDHPPVPAMVDGVAHDVADGARQGERVAQYFISRDLRFEGDIVARRKRERGEIGNDGARRLDEVQRFAPVVHLIVSFEGEKLFGGLPKPRDILHQALLLRPRQALYPGLHDRNRRSQLMRRIDEKTLPRPKLLFKPFEDAVEGKDQGHHLPRHILDRKFRARPARIDLRSLFDDGTEAGKRLAHDAGNREEHGGQDDSQERNVNLVGFGKERQKLPPHMRGSAEHDPDGTPLRLHRQGSGRQYVQVATDVRKRLDALNAELAPQNVQLRIVTDASIPIRESVSQVQTTLIEGAALAVAIVFLFLNSWRSTVISGLTLPIAIIGTLAVIHFLGFTLNTLSLLALTLSIGILVDDAIVVRENITRHLHMGKSHLRAALDGTNEIGLAVIATTATIVAVFLPVAFMDGIVGRFFYEFGVTVSAAVLISLFVAFTLDPMLSSVWYDPDAQPDAKRGPVGRLIARFDHGFEWMAGQYRRAIGWTLRHRLVTLLATAGVFIGSLFMVPLVGTEFVPNADEGRFQVNITAPVGSSLDYTTTKVRQVEKALKEFPEVETLYSTVNTGGAAGKHRAAILVGLVPLDMRSRTPLSLAEPVRKRLSAIPGIEVTILQNGLGGGESPVQLSILGDERAVLEKIATGLVEDMKKSPDSWM
ncbi:AcrB/AcrD/AcrF family protein [Rhizobium sp. NFACC06-2]|nr:AcrB/AcrD/AcrF family protein [Rhizobium sp. NFACC06-2]